MEAKVVGPGWDSGGREKQADVWREVGKLGQFYYMGQFCHEINQTRWPGCPAAHRVAGDFKWSYVFIV